MIRKLLRTFSSKSQVPDPSDDDDDNIGTITIKVTRKNGQNQVTSSHKIDGDLDGILAGQILIDVGRDILLLLAHNH